MAAWGSICGTLQKIKHCIQSQKYRKKWSDTPLQCDRNPARVQLGFEFEGEDETHDKCHIAEQSVIPARQPICAESKSCVVSCWLTSHIRENLLQVERTEEHDDHFAVFRLTSTSRFRATGRNLTTIRTSAHSASPRSPYRTTFDDSTYRASFALLKTRWTIWPVLIKIIAGISIGCGQNPVMK